MPLKLKKTLELSKKNQPQLLSKDPFKEAAEKRDLEAMMTYAKSILNYNDKAIKTTVKGKKGVILSLGKPSAEKYAIAYKYFLKVSIAENPAPSPEMLAESYYYLGICNLQGLGTAQNDKQAFMYFLRAANLLNVEAILKLADLYKEGKAYHLDANTQNPSTPIGEPDLAKAKEWLHKAADLKRNEAAQMALAKLYLKEEDLINAEKYFTLAIDSHKNVEAMIHCAIIYPLKPEIFSEQQINKTYDYCQRVLAKTKDIPIVQAQALKYLGYCYLNGYGIEKSVRQAFDCFKKALRLGQASAEVLLAKCYFNKEIGWQTSIQKGLEMLQNIANNSGHGARKDALMALEKHYGDLLDEHIPAPDTKDTKDKKDAKDAKDAKDINKDSNTESQRKQNQEKYIFWLEKSAAAKNDESMVKLAELYVSGQYCAKDFNKAKKLCLDAMELNYTQAFLLMANWQSKGVVVEQNFKLAFENYNRAGKLGSKAANMSLAKCHCNGQGTGIDYKKAFDYYLKNVDTNGEAAFQIGFSYEQGRGTTRDLKLSVKYYTKAVQLGNAGAMLNLGNCYANGSGIKRNDKEAVRLFSDAANQGLKLANFSLAQVYYFGVGVARDRLKAVDFLDKCDLKDHPFVMALQVMIKHDIEKQKNGNLQPVIAEYERILKLLSTCQTEADGLIISREMFLMAKYKLLNRLAEIYILGPESTRNPDKGIQCLQQSASVEALQLLAYCHLKGLGVPQDTKKALDFFNRASRLGDLEARKFLEKREAVLRENNDIFVRILTLPDEFQKQKQTSTGSLETLMAQVQVNQSAIEANQELASIETLEKVRGHLQVIAVQYEQAMTLSRNFDNRYNTIFITVKDIGEKNALSVENRSAEPEASELFSYMSKYQQCCDNIGKENLKLTTIKEGLLNKNSAKIKEESKKSEEGEELKKKRQALIEQIKKMEENQKTAELALKKQEEERVKKNGERREQRERWLQQKKEKFEARQKSLAQKLVVPKDIKQLLRKQENKFAKSVVSNREQSVSNHDAQIKDFSKSQNKPLPKTLSIWKVAALERKKHEMQLLERVNQHFSKVADEVNLLTITDMWIERETLTNLLGRVLELVKTHQGSQNFPKEVAARLRNFLFKSIYFTLPENHNDDTVKIALEINAKLRDAVSKILAYLKIDPKENPPKNWAELKIYIKSSLLDDLISLPLENYMISRKLSYSTCRTKVLQEKQKLALLKDYNGIFKNNDIITIVQKSCEARWGSLSSYLMRYKKQLIPAISTLELEFNTLVNQGLISKGNNWRHNKEPLLFSSPTASSSTSLNSLSTSSPITNSNTAAPVTNRDKDCKSGPTVYHVVPNYN